MKLTLQDENRIVTLETKFNGLTAPSVVEQLFRPAMLALGYSEELMDRIIGEVNEEGLGLE